MTNDCRTYTVPGLTSTVVNRDYFGGSYWGGSYWGTSWFEWIKWGIPDERTVIIEAEDRTLIVKCKE